MKEIKEQLEAIAKLLNKRKKELHERSGDMINQFIIKKDQHREVAFGIISTADPALQKYVDVLNHDMKLNNLAVKIKLLRIQGCQIILQEALKYKQEIPGYDLQSFDDHPEKYADEIIDFILGLGGYEHIHVIDGKVALEIPVREYFPDHPGLLEYADYWLRETEEF